jgi:ABC-type transporter MlaC component
MTIERARKILGEYEKTLTDEQLSAIIECFDALIEVGFQQYEQQRTTKRQHACNQKRLKA